MKHKGMQMLRYLRCAASGIQSFIRSFEPWGILLVIVSLLISMAAFVVEMEDRQLVKIFRAWEFVLENERHNISHESASSGNADNENECSKSHGDDAPKAQPISGNAIAQALEYINRDFGGILCTEWLASSFRRLTGDMRRRCLIPAKVRSSLEYRYLRGMDLRGINLSGANLRGVDLENAELQSAILVKANLGKAKLEDANLCSANLTGANLNKAILIDATLEGANLTGARLRRANLTEAYFEKADFTRAELRYADFTDTRLDYAIFKDADFEDAIFSRTDISGAQMGEAKNLPDELEGACVSEGEPDPELPPDVSWIKKLC